MSGFTKIDLDARELEHPKPLEYAISALRNLDDTNYFYMLHRKNPLPLLDMAQEQGFCTLSREDNNGTWHILIAKSRTITLEEYLCV
jgi:hypothetical protein